VGFHIPSEFLSFYLGVRNQRLFWNQRRLWRLVDDLLSHLQSLFWASRYVTLCFYLGGIHSGSSLVWGLSHCVYGWVSVYCIFWPWHKSDWSPDNCLCWRDPQLYVQVWYSSLTRDQVCHSVGGLCCRIVDRFRQSRNICRLQAVYCLDPRPWNVMWCQLKVCSLEKRLLVRY